MKTARMTRSAIAQSQMSQCVEIFIKKDKEDVVLTDTTFSQLVTAALPSTDHAIKVEEDEADFKSQLLTNENEAGN